MSINDLQNRLQQTERARRQLAEQLAEVDTRQQGGGRADGDGGEPRVASARSRIEGVIREKRVIAGQNYAYISIGSNDAVAKNMRLNVLNQAGEWIGYVTVTSVDQEEAIGVLSGPRINEARPNDRVTNRIAGQS